MGFFPTLPPSLAPVTPMMYNQQLGFGSRSSQLTEPNLGTQQNQMSSMRMFNAGQSSYRGRGEDRTLKVGSTLLISETRAPFGRVVGYYFGFGYVRRPFYVVRMESDIKTPRGTLIPLVVQKIAEYIDEEDLFKRFNDPVRAAFDIFEEEEEEVNDCQSTTTKRRRMSSEEEIINSNKKILRTCNHYEGQCQDNFNQLLCMQPHHINQPNQMGFVSNLLPSQAPINQPNNMGVVPNPFPFQAPMMYNQQYGTPVMYNQQSMGPVTNQQNQMSSMRMFNAAGQSSYRGRGSHRSRARGLGRGVSNILRYFLTINETRAPFCRVVGYYFGFGYVRRPLYIVRLESDIQLPHGTLIPLIRDEFVEYIDEEDLFKRFHDPGRSTEFDIFEEQQEEVNDCESTTTKRRR
ncbi:unnamed protein product, partial [Brassica oleracea var. botrytis]